MGDSSGERFSLLALGIGPLLGDRVWREGEGEGEGEETELGGVELLDWELESTSSV